MKESATEEEKIWGWHKRCVMLFFGTKSMPDIDISDEGLELLAKATVDKGLTVPGVQKKLSLHLTKESRARLTIVDYPTGYILKPQAKEFQCLPEAEDLCMRLAEAAGIHTVPHGLVKMEKQNSQYAYITKRIDRNISYEKEQIATVEMYAMEDFCQLSYRLTQDKYRGSYERCGKLVTAYSSQPLLDLSELFLRVVFSFITGNSDMHLKNFSFIELHPGSREFVLSRAYDLLPVNVIMPEDEEELALTLNGKKNHIRKKDFFAFAETCMLPHQSAEKMMKKMVKLETVFLDLCETSQLPDEMKQQMREMIAKRVAVIK